MKSKHNYINEKIDHYVIMLSYIERFRRVWRLATLSARIRGSYKPMPRDTWYLCRINHNKFQADKNIENS